jgi:outer membrane protein TolC
MSITDSSRGRDSWSRNCVILPPKASHSMLPWFRWSLLFGAVILGQASSLAQNRQSAASEERSTRFTLEQAVDYALAHYPMIRVSLARVAQAHANIGLAKTQYLPSANLLWQSTRATFNNIFGQILPQAVIPSISGPVLADTSNTSTWGSVGGVLGSWQPFDFGLRHANVLEARAGENIAAQAANLTRLQVAQATANAFIAAVCGPGKCDRGASKC